MSGNRSVRVFSRHQVRGSATHRIENCICACTRIIGLQVLSANIYFHQCCFRRVEIDITTQIITFQPDVIVILVFLALFKNTVLLIKGSGNKVTCTLGSASYIEGIAHIIGMLSQHLLQPVGVGIKVAIGSRTVFGNFFRCTYTGCSFIVQSFIIQFQRLYRIHKFRQASRSEQGRFGTKGYFGFLRITTFRCDQDHSVSTLGTIHSSCRGIFQQSKRFDFIGFYILHITGHTIDQN